LKNFILLDWFSAVCHQTRMKINQSSVRCT